MELKSIKSALAQIAEERGISVDKVIETIESAIASAYKKEYGRKTQKIKAKFDPETGEVNFWQVKLVVDESMLYTPEEIESLKEQKEELENREEENEKPKKYIFNPDKHIMIDEAKKTFPEVLPGQEIEIPLEVKHDYGRIAAQTAKQVILQKIREAEKESIYSEYKSKEGEIVSGIVQRIEGGTVFIDIGKTLGLLQKDEQIPGEFYRPGQRLKVYVLKVETTPKGPTVLLSRTYPKLVSKLFELEVPEIAAGSVVIKAIAREPGFRTKIAVASTQEGVDPVGALVGQRGTRIMAVINDLGGEKIDVVLYDEKPEKFIGNALAPAKVLEVRFGEKNTALVLVPKDQLSLAIGRDGRNVRLATTLTGWKIDVRPVSEEEQIPSENQQILEDEQKEEQSKTEETEKEAE